MSIRTSLQKLSTSTKKTATKAYINRKIAGIEKTAKRQLLDKFKIEKLKDVASTRGIKLTRWDDDIEKWVPMTSKAQIVSKMTSKMEYASVINACKTYGISHKRIDGQAKNEIAQLKSKLK